MAQLRSRVLPKTVRHRSTLSKGELPTARKVHRSFASLRMTGWSSADYSWEGSSCVSVQIFVGHEKARTSGAVLPLYDEASSLSVKRKPRLVGQRPALKSSRDVGPGGVR
jgi:hypothetical protein